MNLPEIIAGVCVAGAVYYLAQRFYHSLHRKDCSKGCGCSHEIIKTK